MVHEDNTIDFSDTNQFTIRLCNCESVLIAECGYKETTRNDIAITYRMAMESERDHKEKIDWRKVNESIINRWSKSGLKYIKERAWKGGW
jgi:hypothetical protein